MRLLVIAPINSIHTIRWINSLINFVEELHIASIHTPIDWVDERIICHNLPFKAPGGYFVNYKELKRVIKRINPDIIHTHFMSGYGTLAALAVDKNKRPHLLSMWGSDIYDFPNNSILHKKLIRWVADKASGLASTSHVMKEQFYKVYPTYSSTVEVTPFGVDIDLFAPVKDVKERDIFNVGIAKNIEDKYGIKYLIEGFSNFNNKYPKSRLHIIGDGSKLGVLKDLVKLSGKTDEIKFYGRVENRKLPHYLNTWDVCVLPSILDSESFGVSAVEASSCGIPVIVANVGGLPEVVEDGVTGIVIPPANSEAITQQLEYLHNNLFLSRKMGENGRQKVLNEYNWKMNVLQMVSIYKKLIKNEF